MTDIINDLNDLFGKELSQAEIQEIVNHPLRHKKEYYLRVFKLALERGITKREQNETY